MHGQARAWGGRAAARPLLSFTAQDAPLPHLTRTHTRQPPAPRRQRSRWVKLVYLLPLVFVFALLAFASYTFLYTLCYAYLWQTRHRTLSAALYAFVFAVLDFGCTGNFWMAYARGTASFVPLPDGQLEPNDNDDDDQEANLGMASSASSQLAKLVRPTLDRDEQEELAAAHEESLEQQEQAALLGGTTTGPEASKLGGGSITRRRLVHQVKSDGSARFCRKCNVPKPDRAHHCSACRRCVLKMDHHCPWLGGGCVGWANYKFFLLALLYTGALGIFTAGIMFHELANYVSNIDDGFQSAPILWAIVGLLGCIFGISVGSFGLYHFYLACKNRTTIEAMEHPTAVAPPPPLSHSSHYSAPFSSGPSPPTLNTRKDSTHTSQSPPSGPSPHQHQSPQQPRQRRLQPNDLTYKQRQRLASAARRYNIYDLGSCARNLEQVFGGREKWSEWFMPWGWPPGDGHSFPVNSTNIDNLRLAIEAVYAEAEATLLAREQEQQEAARQRRQRYPNNNNAMGWSEDTSADHEEGGYDSCSSTDAPSDE